MSFSGNKTARDRVTALLSASLTSILTTVGTEQSVTLAALRKTYTAPPPPGKWVFPCAEVKPSNAPEGVEQGSSSQASTWVMWVILTDTCALASELDSRLTGYMTSLVRLFVNCDDIEIIAADTSPPDALDGNTQIQSIGVQVAVTVLE